MNIHTPEIDRLPSREEAEAALAVLRSLREPSGRMLAVGDADIWDRMITAAIEDESLSD